ncbi:glycosyltransferase family 2 protein [Paenibacillus thalictri]|uniref:glycosyltransferase family 2 protein n=1 Tax=Paenibacillus thalictri TaxID=2527873 RepID=UPI001478E6CB|nr:glycosyltransferase family 2 protein [Paenibacillus thalictri]
MNRWTNTTVSIIILTRNGLEFTRRCVESVMKRTKEKYELIFIDNASNDGTVSYLRSITGAKLILNKQNKGFAGGANQGLAAARGKYITLLNNDTVVTEGWLTRMLWWLGKDRSIGIVGPRSNKVLKSQRIDRVNFKSIDEIESFSKIWSEEHDKDGYCTDRLSGFCMVFHRKLVQKIGGMDERFHIGNSEDIDFCIRTMISGKTLWVANDVYVHHFGGSTFTINNEDHQQLLMNNRKLLGEKWNTSTPTELLPIVERERPFNVSRHYVSYK